MAVPCAELVKCEWMVLQPIVLLSDRSTATNNQLAGRDRVSTVCQCAPPWRFTGTNQSNTSASSSNLQMQRYRWKEHVVSIYLHCIYFLCSYQMARTAQSIRPRDSDVSSHLTPFLIGCGYSTGTVPKLE